MAGNSTSRGHLSHHVASSPIHPFRRSRVLTLSFLFSSSLLRSSSHVSTSPLVSFSSSSGALVKVSLFERRLVRVRFVSRRLLEVFWFLRVPIERFTVRLTISLSLSRFPYAVFQTTPPCDALIFSRRYEYDGRSPATFEATSLDIKFRENLPYKYLSYFNDNNY